MTDLESPCDFRCGYVSSGRDLWEHIAREHRDCTECGAKHYFDEIEDRAVTHKPDCLRLSPGYAYPGPVPAEYEDDGDDLPPG